MLYAGSGSPIPNDTMEQFRASEEDWQRIEAEAIHYPIPGTIWELHGRMAALEAALDRVLVRNQTGVYLRAGTPVYLAAPAKAVPSDEKLHEIWKDTKGGAIEHFRALVDHGYQQGLAAGRAEQQAMAKLPTDSDYDAPQSLHSVALGMVDTLRHRIGVTDHICDTIERAIREPMAEREATCKPALQVADDLTPEPEPIPSPAAGDAGLVEVVVRAMRAAPLGYQPEARAAIRAVARWLRSNDYPIAASLLKQEANR
jgi:hypothetical protein